MAKKKQAEADAINAKFPAWATHLHFKPKLPPRHRPHRKECPVCKFEFAVKARGPIPETCSRRCAWAWELHCAYMRGLNQANQPMKEDVIAASAVFARKRRHAVIIDEMLAGIGELRNRRR